MDDDENPGFSLGPNTVCHHCCGYEVTYQPRLYLHPFDPEPKSGLAMAMGEHRPCRYCHGTGKLIGLQPPL